MEFKFTSVSILYPLQSLQNKLLKIKSTQNFRIQKHPLRIDQIYTHESFHYYYDELEDKFINFTRITRIKSLQLPKINKTISKNSNKIVGSRYFNQLLNDLS